MAAEALEIMVDKRHFKAVVHPGKGDYLEISGNDTAALVALMLRQRRSASGLSLAEVARRLGVKSRNAYARYEQGLSVEKLVALLGAIDPAHDVVLGPAKA
jgi:predicted transcriptional regulator